MSKALLVISVVTDVGGILNEVFSHLEVAVLTSALSHSGRTDTLKPPSQPYQQ